LGPTRSKERETFFQMWGMTGNNRKGVGIFCWVGFVGNKGEGTQKGRLNPRGVTADLNVKVWRGLQRGGRTKKGGKNRTLLCTTYSGKGGAWEKKRPRERESGGEKTGSAVGGKSQRRLLEKVQLPKKVIGEKIPAEWGDGGEGGGLVEKREITEPEDPFPFHKKRVRARDGPGKRESLVAQGSGNRRLRNYPRVPDGDPGGHWKGGEDIRGRNLSRPSSITKMSASEPGDPFNLGQLFMGQVPTESTTLACNVFPQ